MAQKQELRIQTGIIATPSAGVVSIYANSSGQIQVLNSNGTTGSLAGQFSQNLSQVNGAITVTGFGLFGNGGGYASGFAYGTTGTSNYTRFLGEPTQWLVAIGSSGQKLAIPSYSYV